MRADGLRGVFDDGNAAGRGQREHRSHVGALAVEMHGQYGLDAAAGRGFRFQPVAQRLGVEVVGGGIDVDEDGRGVEPGDGPSGGEEGIGGGKDEIARARLERHERGEESVGARGHADAEFGPGVVRDGLLEFLDGRAEDVAGRLDDARDGGVEFAAQGA